MQQYRVNYSLLIGLAIGAVVCSGAVYGLWRFQIERKSGWLIGEAFLQSADREMEVDKGVFTELGMLKKK